MSEVELGHRLNGLWWMVAATWFMVLLQTCNGPMTRDRQHRETLEAIEQRCGVPDVEEGSP